MLDKKPPNGSKESEFDLSIIKLSEEKTKPLLVIHCYREIQLDCNFPEISGLMR
jgi:hypothetical protein